VNGYNNVILLGRIVSEPEMRHLGPNNTPLARFTVVNNRKHGGKEEAHFFDCEMWGERAEHFCRWHHKGDAVFVTGELRQDRWVDTTAGKKMSKIKLNCFTFSFLPKADGQSTKGETGYLERAHREPDRKSNPTNAADIEDDLFGPEPEAGWDTSFDPF
jgi:single-strand DNA-binding protein